jgi:hypothetical protein
MSAPDLAQPKVKPGTIATSAATANTFGLPQTAYYALERAFAQLPIRSQSSGFSSLTSHLGHRNPFVRPIDPTTTTIWLFDNFAYRISASEKRPWRMQPWETQIVAAYFTEDGLDLDGDGNAERAVNGYPGDGKDAEEGTQQAMKRAVAAIAMAAGVPRTKAVEDAVVKSLGPWLFRRVVARTADVTFLTLSTPASASPANTPMSVGGWFSHAVSAPCGRPDERDRDYFPSSRGPRPKSCTKHPTESLDASCARGLSTTTVRLPDNEYVDGEELVVSPMTDHSLAATTRLCSGTGFGIISTVENTLWQVDTSDAKSLIRKIFIDPPTPFEGLSGLFCRLNTKLKFPAFWYLAAAPLSLYPKLRAFRDEHDLPNGTILLHDTPWTTVSGLLASFMQDTEDYKLEQLSRVYEQWPRRSMILLGCTSEVRFPSQRPLEK